jgi:hypothetical protein
MSTNLTKPLRLRNDGGAQLELERSSAVSSLETTSGGGLGISTAGTLALSATGANVLQLNTNGAERMRITSGGNVGIGTTNPVYALDVAGKIGNGLNQVSFSEVFGLWNQNTKITIPLNFQTTSNVSNTLVELNILFATSDSSSSAAGAGKFVFSIRKDGSNTALQGSIETVFAQTIASSWITYTDLGSATGKIEIENDGDWNFAFNYIGINALSSLQGVAFGTITIV